MGVRLSSIAPGGGSALEAKILQKAHRNGGRRAGTSQPSRGDNLSQTPGRGRSSRGAQRKTARRDGGRGRERRPYRTVEIGVLKK